MTNTMRRLRSSLVALCLLVSVGAAVPAQAAPTRGTEIPVGHLGHSAHQCARSPRACSMPTAMRRWRRTRNSAAALRPSAWTWRGFYE